MREIERRKALKRAWENIHPIDRPTWENFKRGQFVLPPTQRDRDFPIAAMEDRDRRAKEWAEHMAEVDRCEELTTQPTKPAHESKFAPSSLTKNTARSASRL